ncbi:MAG: response regulator [Verrucomicrobiales bacterium]|nr:response regulator [Verrucomicrobiales bacterium]
MSSTLRILHLEDDERDGELVRALLAADRLDCHILRVDNRPDFQAALSDQEFDLIISDFTLPAFDGLSALDLSRRLRPDTSFIFVSGTIGQEVAVDSIRRGAVDYIIKDRLERLPTAVRNAVRHARESLERRRAEDRVREQAALLDQANDAIIVQDMEGRITYWNRAAERIYGWSATEAVGQPASHLLDGAGSPRRSHLLPSLLRTGEWNGESRQATRSGATITVSSRRTLLRHHDGQPRAIMEINTDITATKALEDQLRQSQRLESLGAMAGGVAHDLNNLLSPILMASDLLETQTSPEDLRRLASLIKASAGRGASLVRQMLSFARGDPVALRPVAIGPLLQEVARHAIDTFPAGIRVHLVDPPALPPVLADPVQLHQVLFNLCINARDAMPRGGELHLAAFVTRVKDRRLRLSPDNTSGPWVAIAVGDSGLGIRAELLDRIFEPFFTTKPKGVGTGLGLATVATIVKGHGGGIDVASEPERGTTFTIYLPTSAQAAPGKRTDTAHSIPQGHGELILLVDDERAIREVMRQALVSCGYHVLAASSGAEALALHATHQSQVAVVITDALMPEMDGLELIQNLQRRGSAARFICMSGNTPRSADPGVHWLTKPFTATQLLSAIRRVLATASSPPV